MLDNWRDIEIVSAVDSLIEVTEKLYFICVASYYAYKINMLRNYIIGDIL